MHLVAVTGYRTVYVTVYAGSYTTHYGYTRGCVTLVTVAVYAHAVCLRTLPFALHVVPAVGLLVGFVVTFARFTTHVACTVRFAVLNAHTVTFITHVLTLRCLRVARLVQFCCRTRLPAFTTRLHVPATRSRLPRSFPCRLPFISGYRFTVVRHAVTDFTVCVYLTFTHVGYGLRCVAVRFICGWFLPRGYRVAHVWLRSGYGCLPFYHCCSCRSVLVPHTPFTFWVHTYRVCLDCLPFPYAGLRVHYCLRLRYRYYTHCTLARAARVHAHTRLRFAAFCGCYAFTVLPRSAVARVRGLYTHLHISLLGSARLLTRPHCLAVLVTLDTYTADTTFHHRYLLPLRGSTPACTPYTAVYLHLYFAVTHTHRAWILRFTTFARCTPLAAPFTALYAFARHVTCMPLPVYVHVTTYAFVTGVTFYTLVCLTLLTRTTPRVL